jgi:hypothetical protein
VESSIAQNPSQIPVEKGLNMVVVYGLFGVALTTLLVSAATLFGAADTLQGYATYDLSQQATLEQINKESEVRQALFERYAQEGEGVSLSGYYCDPATPPVFDYKPWAREGQNWPVYSGDGYHIGDILPDGTYTHFGVCSK